MDWGPAVFDVVMQLVREILGVSVRLVAAAGFKPVVGSVKQTLGGFDSHPLPLLRFRVRRALIAGRADDGIRGNFGHSS